MSQHDDADPDDEALSGLRSVWLSMGDEEPPQRGLAELMAAARVKADEMAQTHAEAEPSWWQWLLASLRRPQVLALATILILIGGALFVGTRHDKLEAPAPTLATEQDHADIQERVNGAPTEAAGSAAAPAPGTALAEPTMTGTATARADEKAAEPAPPHHDVAKAKQSSPTRPMPKISGASKATMKSSKDDALDFGGSLAADEAAPAPPPSVKDLYAQARTAAANGDCATVKRLAKQIARQDAAFYRANIAPDQSLASCLN